MIDILLATFNGEKYLKDQLDTLFKQSFTDFFITVRDDGSTDKTLEIINEVIQQYPSKIRLIGDHEHLGSTGSFSRLLEGSSRKYIMFCDQDDHWFSNKIELTLARMQEVEKANPGKPVLVFTDLIEGDDQLNVISDSFIKRQKLNTSIVNDPIKLTAHSVITGCTVMINRESKEFTLPIPANFIIHDQWIGIKIAKHGIVSFLDETTLIYRIHASNTVGANDVGIKYFFKKLSHPRKQIRIYKTLLTNLKLKNSFIKFLYYKTLFTLKRL